MLIKRQPIICGQTAILPLAGGHEALIDAADAEACAQHNWWLVGPKRCQHVSTQIRGGSMRLTRFLTGEHNVDHVNSNPLDNRRVNLRSATPTQQSANRRPVGNRRFKGVYVQGHRYRARINGVHIGMYDTPEDAARAYDRAALVLYGAFARTNYRYRQRV